MNDDRTELVARLRAYRAPDEEEAEVRGLRVVRAAFATRSEAQARRRPRWRLALAALAAIALAGFALTPAGAEVRDLIEDALTVEQVEREPLRLPGEGAVLTVNRDGAWIASEQGTRRFLGRYRQASLSPRGLNVAVAAGRELAAVDRVGELQWQLRRPKGVADPAWAPSGLRIAYRSGTELRIVEGDGTPDRLLARGIAPVAPVWRPTAPGDSPRDVIAFAAAGGTVRLVDAASRGEGIELDTDGEAVQLEWLDDGLLVVAGDRAIELFAAEGGQLGRFELPDGVAVTDIDAQPDGSGIAFAGVRPEAGGGHSTVSLLRFEDGESRERRVFSASGPIAGLAFSPDGRWLGFGWPGADSWLFARPLADAKPRRRSEAISGISSRFEDGGARGAPPGFPRIVEWERLAEPG